MNVHPGRPYYLHDGTDQNPQVSDQRPVLDVLPVEPPTLCQRKPIPPRYLPQPCHSGTDPSADSIRPLIEREGVFRSEGPRSDQAHLTP